MHKIRLVIILHILLLNNRTVSSSSRTKDISPKIKDYPSNQGKLELMIMKISFFLL